MSILSPLGWLYGRVADLRNTLYDKGVFESHGLGARTISVGNITAGGTGKTPLVILISQILAERGERVCILTRGYGRTDPHKRVLVSNGTDVFADARTGGDEPLEMARKLLGHAIVVADADRVAAAKWAKQEFGVTAFVLDDGFQHRRVKRDVDILCIDATAPFGGGKMLPAGRLREPLVNLTRAGMIVITRADLVENIGELRSEIAAFVPGIPVFTAATRTADLTPLEKFLSFEVDYSTSAPSGDLSGPPKSRAFAFCALGNPASFFGQLRKNAVDVAGTQAFADHYFYSQKDIDLIDAKAKRAGAEYLLTTGKDAAKMVGLRSTLPCFVLETAIAIDDRERFAALL